MRFVGNLTTWMEILTSDIKEYLSINGGKCDYIPGKISGPAFKGVLHPWPIFGLFMHFSQKLQPIGDK